MRHVADRLRRTRHLDHLPRQAHAQPHPYADHRPCQPRDGGQAGWRDHRLHRRVPQPAAGVGVVWVGVRRGCRAG